MEGFRKGNSILGGPPWKKKNSKPCTVYRKQYADTKSDHFRLQTQFLLLKLDPNLGFLLLLILTRLTSSLQGGLTCTITSNTHTHLDWIKKKKKTWISRTSKSSKPALIATVTIPLPLYCRARRLICCRERKAVESCSLVCSRGSLWRGKPSHWVQGVWTGDRMKRINTRYRVTNIWPKQQHNTLNVINIWSQSTRPFLRLSPKSNSSHLKTTPDS